MEQRIANLEEEVNLIKNQIRAVLLDIKENLSGGDWQISTGFKPVNSLPEEESIQPEVNEGTGDLKSEMNAPNDTMSIPADVIKNNGAERVCSKEALSHPSGSTIMYGTETSGNNSSHELVHNNGWHQDTNHQAIRMDPLSMVMFINWIERSQAALGHEETGKLLEIYASSRDLPEENRQTLRLLMGLFQKDKDAAATAAAIPYLMELDDLFRSQHDPSSLQDMVLKMILQRQHSESRK